MKRTVSTALCLGVLTFLNACGNGPVSPELTSVGEQENGNAEGSTHEPTAAGGDRDNPTAGLTGPLAETGMERWVERYSPATLAKRAYACDGVVTDIGQADSHRPDRGHLELVGVTFAVGEGSRVGPDRPSPSTWGPRSRAHRAA